MRMDLKRIISKHPILLGCFHWLLIVAVILLLGRWSGSWARTIDPHGNLVPTDHDLCYTLLDALLYCLLGIVLKKALDHKPRLTAVTPLPLMIAVPLALAMGCAYDGSLSRLGIKTVIFFTVVTPCLLSGIGFITVLQQWYQAQLSRTYRGLFCLGLLATLLPSSLLLCRCIAGICLLGVPSVAEFIDRFLICPHLVLPSLAWLGWMIGVGCKALWNIAKSY